jgi:hypothetical protein
MHAFELLQHAKEKDEFNVLQSKYGLENMLTAFSFFNFTFPFKNRSPFFLHFSKVFVSIYGSGSNSEPRNRVLVTRSEQFDVILWCAPCLSCYTKF